MGATHAKARRQADTPGANNHRHAPTSAGIQYQKDASAALELAAHGTVAKAADEALGEQFRQQAINAHQIRDKITFLWSHLK
jgi:hypothetical protein